MLLRHTVASLGAALAYAAGGEGCSRGAVAGSRPWLLRLNITGVAAHGTTYVVDRSTSAAGGYSCERSSSRCRSAHSATYLGVLLVALVLVTALVFRRRDVR